jgi:ankyrin repeat protein
MYSSSSTRQSIETIEEITKINVYDDNGYLPIHRAAFNGQENIIKNILDDAQKRNELPQQLEAITHDTNEFTPLLLATAIGRLEIIACLLKYPVNFNAVDANGHGKFFQRKYLIIDIFCK